MGNNTSIKNNNQTIEKSEILDAFCRFASIELGLSKNSVQSYRYDIEKFLINTDKNIDVITHDDIVKYMTILTEKNLGSRSKARHLSSIKAFFKFLLKDNIITQNPTNRINNIILTKKLPQFLDIQEIQLLVKSCQLISPKKEQQKRAKAFILMLYGGGMRVSELITLPYDTINKLKASTTDDETAMLSISGKGKKMRKVPIPPIAQKAIFEYEASITKYSTKWLFPSSRASSHISRQRVFQILKQLAELSNIAPHKVHPHILRHTFATHLLQNGSNLKIIQSLLGHKSIATTQTYTHIMKENLLNTMHNYHPLCKQ